MVDAELAASQRVCEAVGRDVSSELWPSAVELNDALSAYLSQHRRVYRAAAEVGFTSEQWRDIKYPPAG